MSPWTGQRSSTPILHCEVALSPYLPFPLHVSIPPPIPTLIVFLFLFPQVVPLIPLHSLPNLVSILLPYSFATGPPTTHHPWNLTTGDE